MMEEESTQLGWLVNCQQAVDSLADEMVFAEHRSKLDQLFSMRTDIENQIYLHLPARH